MGHHVQADPTPDISQVQQSSTNSALMFNQFNIQVLGNEYLAGLNKLLSRTHFHSQSEEYVSLV
jgi:hypothetical protein